MLEDWAIALAGTPWVLLVLYVFTTIDGFFPPIPSESLVIGLAALSVSAEESNLWLIGLAGAAGAFTGDQTAYSIGKHLPVRRLRFMQGGRAQKALSWAERALAERGAAFIIAARYIPVGRVAVNMTAGAVGYARRRFSLLAALAALTWATYSMLLGIGAGIWFRHHPILAVTVGVAGGCVIGFIVDRVLSGYGRRRGRGRGGVGPDGTAEPVIVTAGQVETGTGVR